MSDRAIGRHAVRPRQDPGGHVDDARGMGAHIGALIVEIAIVDGENDAMGVERGANLVHLLARMIGGDQVLTAIFEPFHRAMESLGGDADQDVFRVKFAANAESAADIRFMNVNCARRQTEHARQQFLIAVRHLGGAVQFKNAVRRVIAADCAARFQRHAGMPADGQFQFDDVRRFAEYGVDVAIALPDHGCFAGMARRKFGRRCLRVEQWRQFVDLDRNEIGGILGSVGVRGKHCGDRIADIAHAFFCQHRLAIGIERRNAALAKIDRRHFGDVVGGPHREHAGQRPRRRGVDRLDAAVGMRGAHDAHGELVREIDVAGELAAPGD